MRKLLRLDFDKKTATWEDIPSTGSVTVSGMSRYNYKPKSRFRKGLETTGAVLGLGGIFGGIALYVAVCVVASLSVPALAFWALGHFAFGWW